MIVLIRIAVAIIVGWKLVGLLYLGTDRPAVGRRSIPKQMRDVCAL